MKFQLQNFLESLELGLNGDRKIFFFYDTRVIRFKHGISSVAMLKCTDNEFLNGCRRYVNRKFLSMCRYIKRKLDRFDVQ